MNETLYPTEVLDGDYDNGTMPENVAILHESVVGHRIVSAEKGKLLGDRWGRPYNYSGLVLTLDNGRRVCLANTDDCCAYTMLEAFLLNLDKVDHVITGVGTTDGYTRWHIFADVGDVLNLTVDWSAGNPFYYGYGFDIVVVDEAS